MKFIDPLNSLDIHNPLLRDCTRIRQIMGIPISFCRSFRWSVGRNVVLLLALLTTPAYALRPLLTRIQPDFNKIDNSK